MGETAKTTYSKFNLRLLTGGRLESFSLFISISGTQTIKPDRSLLDITSNAEVVLPARTIQYCSSNFKQASTFPNAD